MSRRKKAPSVDLEELQTLLDVQLRDPSLLGQALVHRSFLNENPGAAPQSNERLEFLGDAVLGCVVAERLYQEYQDLPEGQLTELRAALVRGETLARVAARYRLGDFLLLGRGEEASGGRERTLNLARALEAVVGAVFLDGGFEGAKAFVLRCLRPELQALGPGVVLTDAKSRLQHLAQAMYQQTPSYRTVATEGPDHAKQFTVEVSVGDQVLGVGRGRSKQAAEKEAARLALEELAHREGPSD
ncbi:MAG TPA: ribonuclease III [Dehalococcoidia bacterium]